MQKHEENLAARINGNALQPLAGASVTVTDDATGLPAALYSDDGVTPLAQPVITGNEGEYAFYAANGEYTVTFSGTRFATFTRKVILADPSDNPYLTQAAAAAPTGAAQVGFVADGDGAVARTAEDKGRERKTFYDYMTPEQRNNCYLRIGTVDVTTAVQNAINAGAAIPSGGTFLLSATITTPANIDIRGAGGRNTLFLAAAGFTGDTVFELGSPTIAYLIPSVSLRDVTIDLQANVDAGITCYGLQDGSLIDNVYVRGIRKYGIRTRWTVDGSTYLMNQGLKISNTHVLSRNDGGAVSNGAYYDLSGLYESTIDNCKALGYDTSGAVHTNMYGFLIGGVNTPGLVDADCQGVRGFNCSVGNMIGTGNVAIKFGGAFDCSHDYPTIENCEGKAVVFGKGAATGTGSDQYSAARCFVGSPRMYNPAANPLVAATAFEFSADAAQCAVQRVPVFSALAGQKMARFLDNCASCSVDILSGNVAAASAGGYFDFTSPNASNVVRAYTDDTTTKQAGTYTKDQLHIERFTDGTTVVHTQYYTQVKLATDMRFCKGDGTSILSVTPGGAVVMNTAILPTSGAGSSGTVWRDAAAGNVLKIVP